VSRALKPHNVVFFRFYPNPAKAKSNNTNDARLVGWKEFFEKKRFFSKKT
jgi:hypothetical protein